MYKLFFKRFFDFIMSLLGILTLLPIIVILIAALLIVNRGSPLFLQPRPGRNERIFKIIKFKTMTDKKDQNGNLLPDMQRITTLGSFIRKYSLDEILQLLNVLKGDMSLIGPRPLLVEYLPLYNDEQKRRHTIRPGITGWAQINGRNALNWQQKFDFDIWYVDNYSFMLDFKILFLTILKVFKSEGINASDKITTGKFTGNIPHKPSDELHNKKNI
ncbi:MAG: sugar transferase [Flavobacteriaceae bacterium]|nr:sugar transferase [Flavobacteriaceae bacterium]